MVEVIFYAATCLLAIIGLAGSPLECGITNMFSLTKEELTKRLANDDLDPDQVFKLIKKGTHAKASGELKLNGLALHDLLGLSHIKITDCDDDIVLERIGQCEQATRGAEDGRNQFASVVGYCKDRVAKLIGYCAKNIEELTEECLFEVEPRDLDIIRRLLAKHIHETEPDFKSLIDDYLAPHQYDRPTERKHADLGNGCEHFKRAFEPIKVVVEHEKEFGVAATESERVSGWMKAYKMCEFYFVNYKDCELCIK